MYYQQAQSKEVCNVAKAVHDLCEAYKKLDPRHQQQAFFIALAEVANEFGWNNRQKHRSLSYGQRWELYWDSIRYDLNAHQITMN